MIGFSGGMPIPVFSHLKWEVKTAPKERMMEITLEQLLESRDRRWVTEQRLLKAFPGKVLIVLTVVMPGKVKRDVRTAVIARAAEAAVDAFLGPRVALHYRNDAPTGFEGYWLVDGDARAIKRQMCGIEDFHPLGRLFDIDVIRPDATPMPRTEVGFEPRRCLLCDHEARWCMRNHTHSQEEIQQRIDAMVREYNAEE